MQTSFFDRIWFGGVLLFLLTGMVSCVSVTPAHQPTTTKKSTYEEVDLEGMIRRYIAKPDQSYSALEGIYSVSTVITRKGGTIFSDVAKERLVLRKDNYARVAIVRNWPGASKEYVELSMSEKNASRYPIVAELQELSEGGGFIYKHFEPNGDVSTYTFFYDQNNPEILEGVYTEIKNGVSYTYKLSYVKIYPKNNKYQTRQ
jgi:hypothetical protein